MISFRVNLSAISAKSTTGVSLNGSLKYITVCFCDLAVFVASLLSTFLLISKIGGKKMKAQIDEFTKLIAICTGALMIGALFMMIPNIFVRTLAFAGLLVLFTGTILAAFLWISKMGGRKIKAQMNEFAKFIAICAGVLTVGALFMMIPAYRENAWKFALMLGGFVAAMAVVMILLAKTSKNIAIGTLCMIALVGVTFLFGFALQNVANAYKIFKDPGEAFICLGWVAGVLVMSVYSDQWIDDNAGTKICAE